MRLYSVLHKQELTKDERLAHLLAHAETCTDPRVQFAMDVQTCTPLRREYFDHALKTPAARWFYWLDGEVVQPDRVPDSGGQDTAGLITCAYIELPRNVVWAELRSGATHQDASKAVMALEDSQPDRDVHWWFDPRDATPFRHLREEAEVSPFSRWLADRELKKASGSPARPKAGSES